KLLGRDDVGRRLDALERAVHHLPPRWHRIHLPPSPPRRGLTVEQQAPAGGAFGGGERVERGGPARRCLLSRSSLRRGRQRPRKAGPQQGDGRELVHVFLLSLSVHRASLGGIEAQRYAQLARPRSRISRDSVAWVTAKPSPLSSSRSCSWLATRPERTILRIAACRCVFMGPESSGGLPVRRRQ